MDKTIDVAVEELAELQQALLKFKRANVGDNPSTAQSKLIDHIAEESADVRIMMWQFEYLLEKYKYSDSYKIMEERKVNRLAERLETNTAYNTQGKIFAEEEGTIQVNNFENITKEVIGEKYRYKIIFVGAIDKIFRFEVFKTSLVYTDIPERIGSVDFSIKENPKEMFCVVYNGNMQYKTHIGFSLPPQGKLDFNLFEYTRLLEVLADIIKSDFHSFFGKVE
jgi:hypothetical protein